MENTEKENLEGLNRLNLLTKEGKELLEEWKIFQKQNGNR